LLQVGVGTPSNTTTDNTNIVGSYSDEPSLLDFASPPSTQDVASDVDLLQHPQSQPEPQQQVVASSNRLDFGATQHPQPQTQEAAAPPVDLFGGPQLLPSSPAAPSSSSTMQPPSQAAQPVDSFGASTPSATPPLPATVTASIAIGDAFAPVAAAPPVAAVAVATADPLGVLLQSQAEPQSQPQAASFPDPLSSLPLSAQPEPKSKSTTTITAATAVAVVAVATTTTNPSGSLPLATQPDPISSATKSSSAAEATAATAPETPQCAITIDKSGEEGKINEESPIVPVVSAKEEEIVAAVAISSSSGDSVGNGDNQEEAKASPPKGNIANVVAEEGSISGEKESNQPDSSSGINPPAEGSLVASPKPATAVEETEMEGSTPVQTSKDDTKSSSDGITEKEPTLALISSSNNTSDIVSETREPGMPKNVADTNEDKKELDKVNQVDNPPASSSSSTTTTSTKTDPVSEPVATNENGGAISTDSKATSGTKIENEVPKLEGHNTRTTAENQSSTTAVAPTHESKFLSTLTKSPRNSEPRSPAISFSSPVVAKRFASFESRSPGISISSPVVAKRFASFKTMAESMAAKGAERVAKVKDQIQKEDDGQNGAVNGTATATATANSKRFANFKTIAGSMAAKGAERVAKVKDQIQKEETDGQNRFAGFKSNIAARRAKSTSAVQVPQQLTPVQAPQRFASVQIPQRFATAAKMPLFGKGNRIENSSNSNTSKATNSDSGSKSSLDSTGASSSSAAAPESSPQTASETIDSADGPQNPAAPSIAVAATDSKPPSNPSTSPSTPIAATNDTTRDAEGSAHLKEVSSPKQPIATDAQTGETGNTSGKTGTNATIVPERSGINGKSSLLSQAQPVSSTPRENNSTEPDPNTNNVTDSSIATKSVSTESESVGQKLSEADTHTSDAMKSSELANGVESAQNGEQSTPVPPPVSATTVNDTLKEAQNSTTPCAKDSSVDSKLKKTEGMASSSSSTAANQNIAARSANSSDNSKSLLTPNTASPKDDTKPSSSEPTASNPTTETQNSTVRNSVGTSNKPQPQQTPSKPLQSSPSILGTSDQVEILRKELHAAHTLIMQLQHHENVEVERPGDAVMVELQANLQQEMTRRAEAENQARVAIAKSKQIEEEAENQARVAIAKSKQIEEEYTTFKTMSKSNLDVLTNSVENLNREKDAMEKELVDIREERDMQARKEMALTTRLNAAKKKEAVKANAAEHYEDQVDQLELSTKEYEVQVESLTTERDQLKVELGEWKGYAEKRTKQLETALHDEKKLNDERKRKMKGFVETKTEEVRSAKTGYLSLQTELDHTSHSLTELNQRYKQLHAQWVQSQTRNRELQRDAMKLQKDSEKMHKVGGSLEARLSRSAQQSEDHKNKRIHARNELMSVLGQLETERAVNSRFQESIRLTFTPKALSQQQIILEALDDFQGALEKLSTRIGRPLPPTFSNDSNASTFSDNQSLDDGSVGLTATNSGEADADGSNTQGSVTLSEINTNRAVQKLENETQRVSQNILKFSASVESMHGLLDGGGSKNCVDVLSQMLLMSGNKPAIAANPKRRSTGGQRYGQISTN